MFPVTSMFGMVDPKTIQDTLMENEEYLEKVIEKLPYIGEEYKKEKEIERIRKERIEAGEDPYDDETENQENQDNNAQQQEQENVNSESYLERVKKGISYYWNSMFVNSNQPPAENVLPKDDQYTVVSMETPVDNTKKIEIKSKNTNNADHEGAPLQE